MSSRAPRRPIMILTGFLGAGKTTLLNHLLGLPEFERTAVVINEIGDVGIDQHLMDDRAVKPMLLAGGCICCTYSKEVAHVLRDLVEREHLGLIAPLDRIIIETTGLADPLPILRELATDQWVSSRFDVGPVLALVDAPLLAAGRPLLDEAIAQVAVADRILMTKADLVAPDQRDIAYERLVGLSAAPIAWSALGSVDTDFLLDSNALGQGLSDDWKKTALPARHSDGIAIAAVELDGALLWGAASRALDAFCEQMGPNLLRLKGLLRIEGVSQAVAVHAVQGMFFPPHAVPYPRDQGVDNRLVLIGRNIDITAAAATLFEALGSCGSELPAPLEIFS